MEVWKDIPGYEGRYQVSNAGNVRSVSRLVTNNRNGGKRLIKEAILRPWDNGHGYFTISLRVRKCRRSCYVHRLVAEAFIPNPDGLPQVNHIDHNRANNSADNLEWCSVKENIRHSSHLMKKPKTVCKPTNTGEKYISLTKGRNGKMFFRVRVRQFGADRDFNNLQDAITYRNEVMNCGKVDHSR